MLPASFVQLPELLHGFLGDPAQSGLSLRIRAACPLPWLSSERVLSLKCVTFFGVENEALHTLHPW